jgi:GMP synthase-like glutamine amidotransferase
VVANAQDADPGFVGQRLVHHGFDLEEVHREEPRAWPTLDAVELVLLLGSEWSVYRDSVAPSVEAESALVKTAAEQGVPVLGICFGAQMVAHAFGGSVTRAARPEVGWFAIESDLPAIIDSGPWLQWHYDVFSVPDGFECLARSDVGPQFVRRGRIAATQFHPEATEAIVERWSSESGVEELGRLEIDRTTLLKETRSRVRHSHAASDRLVDWFLADVAGT